MRVVDRRRALDSAFLQAEWVYERTQGFRNICYVFGARCGNLFLHSIEFD